MTKKVDGRAGRSCGAIGHVRSARWPRKRSIYAASAWKRCTDHAQVDTAIVLAHDATVRAAKWKRERGAIAIRLSSSCLEEM